MGTQNKIKIFEEYMEMCRKIAEEIKADWDKNPRQMLCIAAGHTSLGVFDILKEMFEKKEIDFSQSYFVAMDEWLNMNEHTPGSCGDFLLKNFLNHVNYAPERVCLWDGCADRPQTECERVEAFVKENSENGRIDFLVLGCGMNGHLALNEPGVDFKSGAHMNLLDSMTKKVGQKYFEGEVPLEGGLTLGIRNFKEAERAILMINGSHKAEIAQRILESGQADARIPATVMKEFENGSIYCDREAVPEMRVLTKEENRHIF